MHMQQRTLSATSAAKGLRQVAAKGRNSPAHHSATPPAPKGKPCLTTRGALRRYPDQATFKDGPGSSRALLRPGNTRAKMVCIGLRKAEGQQRSLGVCRGANSFGTFPKQI
jgi:hypothetical protein